MPTPSPPPRERPDAQKVVDLLSKAMDKMDPSDMAAVAGIAGEIKAARESLTALRADITAIDGNMRVLNRKLDQLLARK